MADAAVQRVNMVDSQVRPSDVTDRRIIGAMLEVPRDQYVPTEIRSLAYSDADLELGQGRQLLAPRTLAKLIQLADINAGNSVLVIGSAPAYVAAICAELGARVVSLSEAEQGGGEGKFVSIKGRLADGYVPEGPYDVILVAGGVAAVPGALRRQLKDGGRLVAILMTGKAGHAVLVSRSNSVYGEAAFFDATAHVLPGFENASAFTL